MKSFAVVIFFVFLFFIADGQDSLYVKKIMNSLCSSEFSGRAYVNGGIDSAANLIGSEFKRIGLRPCKNSFFQPFTVAANNINVAKITLNNQDFVVGEEFVLDNHCKSLSATFKTFYIDDKIRNNLAKQEKLKSSLVNKIQIIDLRGEKNVRKREWCNSVAYANPFGANGSIVLDTTMLSYNVALYGELKNDFVAKINSDKIPVKKIKSVKVDIQSEYVNNYKVNNVIGCLQGRECPDSFIVVSAHYDHVGKIAEKVFPGGNDNASGVAMMLDLAKTIAKSRFRPRYSLIFIAFASEELGLKGSEFLAENPIFDLKKIRFMLNLDMVGTGSDGIVVVNGLKYKKEFLLLQQLNSELENPLRYIKARGESCNSDHCPFYKKGVPSFFIYTAGKEYIEYHSVNDKAENVPLTAYDRLYRVVENFIYTL